MAYRPTEMGVLVHPRRGQVFPVTARGARRRGGSERSSQHFPAKERALRFLFRLWVHGLPLHYGYTHPCPRLHCSPSEFPDRARPAGIHRGQNIPAGCPALRPRLCELAKAELWRGLHPTEAGASRDALNFFSLRRPRALHSSLEFQS